MFQTIKAIINTAVIACICTVHYSTYTSIYIHFATCRKLNYLPFCFLLPWFFSPQKKKRTCVQHQDLESRLQCVIVPFNKITSYLFWEQKAFIIISRNHYIEVWVLTKKSTLNVVFSLQFRGEATLQIFSDSSVTLARLVRARHLRGK